MPLARSARTSSRVRPLLTDARPFHIGVNAIELGVPDADRTHPELAAMVGRGNYWALGPDQPLAAATRGYETAMFERTAAAAQESVDIMKVLTAPAGARGVLRFFQHHQAPAAR